MSQVAVKPTTFGAFGKIPALGDFFRAGLPRAFVDPWDIWLQQSLLAVRTQMGDGWTNAYLSAPIWRFSLAAGLAGPQAITGVMMPSVDRVGRQFPLTLARPLPDSVAPVLDHAAADDAFALLETIALAALEDDMTREILSEKLAEVAVPPTGTATMNHTARTVTICGATPFAAIAQQQVASQFQAPSLWSAELADGPIMMICEGLPGAVQAHGLFDLTAPIWQTGGTR